MVRFAFIVHPITPKDIARKHPAAKLMPDAAIEAMMRTMKPSVASRITGVESITGAKTEGIFIGLPLTPTMFLEDPLELVYDKIVACCDIAADEGCQIIGLGAFTSVVGDGGVTVASRSKIAVTTGNSYTVATAIEGTLLACQQVGLTTAGATLAVVGATGAIGRTCAICLAPAFAKTLLVGRDQARTEAVAAQVARGEATTDMHRVREADVIVTVTSSDTAVIQPEDLKPGSIVCDVARPRDVSVRVAKERPDVLVIEGGVVSVPGDVDFGLDFGFPPKTAYACMSETMMLALDGRAESFTLGKDVTVEQVEETQRLARKHGFHLSGFRSFEKAVDQTTIERVRAARTALV
ncbi:MAG: shikimate dehydrogenase [Armatimonadetes bacterium]|nr:shikimate dehydrogenase [Armatimonadota bacterium]